jgi:hypothetical protein
MPRSLRLAVVILLAAGGRVHSVRTTFSFFEGMISYSAPDATTR